MQWLLSDSLCCGPLVVAAAVAMRLVFVRFRSLGLVMSKDNYFLMFPYPREDIYLSANTIVYSVTGLLHVFLQQIKKIIWAIEI